MHLLGKLKSVPSFGGLEVDMGTHRGEYLRLPKLSGGIPFPVEFYNFSLRPWNVKWLISLNFFDSRACLTARKFLEHRSQSH